jgi:hypothetical protein
MRRLVLEALFEFILVIISVPVGLFLFIVLFSWVVALAADPYAGLPSDKERKTMLKKRKEKRRIRT